MEEEYNVPRAKEVLRKQNLDGASVVFCTVLYGVVPS
jgi:hypothetical protein